MSFIPKSQRLFLVAMIVGAGTCLVATSALNESVVKHVTSAPVQASNPGALSSLGSATAWMNSPPLTASELRGKVVLVNFWTYTCIYWVRSLPYVRAWAAKYKDRGLVVIGVHAPEFGFEKNLDNVRRAVKTMAIEYPVAIDNDYSLWRAFRNEGWPALYFVDAQGRVRRQQLGEGRYEEAERYIQRLLTEAGAQGIAHDLVAVDARGVEAAADWDDLRTPETYVRHRRIQRFASPGGVVPRKRHAYAAPLRLPLNNWALAGAWTLEDESAVLNEAGGRIVYRFHARDLHLVMGPSAHDASVRFRVLIDGRPPGAARGSDVDERGYGTVAEQRLYHLIRQTAPIGDRQFEIEFLDAGVDAFAFTFG